MWDIVWRTLKRGVETGQPAIDWPASLAPAPRVESGELEVLGNALRAEVQRVLKRSLRLRHMDAGSCNACESELQALLNPFHDLQRFGIDVVASPRHADGLLVTGPPSRHLEEALRLTEEATPRPRLIIAVGDCACHGGFCAGSFATLDGVQSVTPVDVRIPGCPPRPPDIARALLTAIGRLDAIARIARPARPATAPAPRPGASA
jgi:Ni,Fe-hydrogenase III small subunit